MGKGEEVHLKESSGGSGVQRTRIQPNPPKCPFCSSQQGPSLSLERPSKALSSLYIINFQAAANLGLSDFSLFQHCNNCKGKSSRSYLASDHALI